MRTRLFLSSNPECRYVASSSKDGSVRVWDTTAGRCERILTGHTQSVTCLRWGGDGLLYSASQGVSPATAWLHTVQRDVLFQQVSARVSFAQTRSQATSDLTPLLAECRSAPEPTTAGHEIELAPFLS